MARAHSIRDYPGQMAGLAGLAALIGVASAMLFTPRRGAEMRQDIMKRGLSMKDRFMKLKRSEKETAKKAAARTKTTARTAAKRTKKSSNDLTDQIRRHGEP